MAIALMRLKDLTLRLGGNKLSNEGLVDISGEMERFFMLDDIYLDLRSCKKFDQNSINLLKNSMSKFKKKALYCKN